MPIPYLKSPQGWKKDGYYIYSQQKTAKNKSKPHRLNKPRKKKNKIKNFIRGLTALTVILFFIGLISLVGVLGYYSRDLPDPNKLIDRVIPESTKIYDRTGETLLYDIHGEIKRTMINLEDVPKHVVNATIVAEDRNFWQHKGFSITGIVRAILVDIFQGGRLQGGSTITQQLIKNAILTAEKSYERKIKELALAYKIEQKFSKEEILKMYFNEIPYGSTAYGIEAAAQTYFGKSVKNVSLAEAAILAALPKRPTYLSPYGNHQDELFARQQYLLEQMVQEGYITAEEATAARDKKITFKTKQENIIAPHFVMYIKELLTEKYGETMVEQGGLKIYTTLDLAKQKLAEEIITKYAPTNLEKYQASNAALIALDVKTNQILAMVGSKDYWDERIDGNVNVTLRPRQPGSSFKPIVYATAFSRGYTSNTILFDVTTTFKNYPKDYTPHNYDLKEHGPVTMKKALAGSLNIPAVKTLYLAGLENVLKQAEKMGYTTFKDKSRFGLALVLGGGEVKLLEHTNAFTVFAKEGKYQPATPFLKVIDKDNRAIIEYKEKTNRVLDQKVAQEMNNILSDNQARGYIFGAESKLTLGPDRPVAAKSGTTNDFRDGWTIGYTPSLAAGVWVGNSDNTAMKRGADGANIAAPIWHDFMTEALKNTEVEKFNPPTEELITDESAIIKTPTTKPILNGELSEEQVVRLDRQSGKLATEFTPPDQIIEKKYRTLHSILYYINKDDPQGPPPENPASDPQYENWEKAVREYVKKEGIEIEKPPQEYDDIHLATDQPIIKIIAPANNFEVKENNINITVEATAPRGIQKIRYYIDGVLISTNTSGNYLEPYNATFNAIENGFHQLEVWASDDLNNIAKDTITLNFLLPQQKPNIIWTSPRNNASYFASSLPLTIKVELSRWQDVQKITFVYEKNSTQTTLENFTDFSSKDIEFKWGENLTAGNYQIYGQIEDLSGQNYQSNVLNLEILE